MKKKTLITEYGLGDGFFNSRIKSYYRNMYVYGCLTESDLFDSNSIYKDSHARMERIGWLGLIDWDDETKNKHRWRLSESREKTKRLDTDDSRMLSRNPTHIFYRFFRATGPDALFFLTVLLNAVCIREDNDNGVESPGRA